MCRRGADPKQMSTIQLLRPHEEVAVAAAPTSAVCGSRTVSQNFEGRSHQQQQRKHFGETAAMRAHDDGDSQGAESHT